MCVVQDPFFAWAHTFELSLQRGLTERQRAARVIFGVDATTCGLLTDGGIAGCIQDPTVDVWAATPWGPPPPRRKRLDMVNSKSVSPGQGTAG
jgi:hypothetical protein